MGTTLKQFAEKHGKRQGPSCSIEKSPRRKQIEAGLAGGFAATTISRWLKAEYGEEIQAQTLTRHRAGDCRCRRS